MDHERDESICTPSNLYEVTLSMICEEIVSNGKFVLVFTGALVPCASVF